MDTHIIRNVDTMSSAPKLTKSDLSTPTEQSVDGLTTAHRRVLVQTHKKARLRNSRRAEIAKKSRQINRRSGHGR